MGAPALLSRSPLVGARPRKAGWRGQPGEPGQASTMDRGQPQLLPGVGSFCQAPKVLGMVNCCLRSVGPPRLGSSRPPGRGPNQPWESPLVQLSRTSENQSRSCGGSWILL